MKIKHYIVYILLCIGLNSNLLAQSPGYLGKKHQVQFDNLSFPSLTDKKSLINMQVGLCVERVLSRNLCLGASGRLFATSLAFENANPAFDKIVISGWTGGLHLKHYSFFKKGNIAPIGPYQKVGIRYWESHFIDKFEPYQFNGDLRNISISAGIGSERVIYKFITIHYGMDFHYLIPTVLSSRVKKGEDTIIPLVVNRLQKFSMVNLSFGLGFLVF